MDKSLEISLRLAEDSMKRSMKLEERVTELENLNNELQFKISQMENQANYKANGMVPNPDKQDDLQEQLTAKERTIMELQEALTAQKEETLTEKKKVLDFQKNVKEMENEIKALETSVAKGSESIKEHEEKMEEMIEYLKGQNQALTEDLDNARKQLATELDAKERKILEAEDNLRVEKEKHEMEIKELKEKLKGMEDQWKDRGSKIVRVEQELGARKEEMKTRDRKIMELQQQLQAEKDKAQATLANQRKRIREENEQKSIFHSKIVTKCENDEIGLKKMGVIDLAPFLAEAKRIKGKSKIIANKGLSYWEKFVNDPTWNPFKIIVNKDGSHVEILDETNEELGRLKTNHNVEVYKAVKKALEEMIENNRRGRYPVLEFWNFSKNRKAALEEAEAYLVGRVSLKRRKIIHLD